MSISKQKILVIRNDKLGDFMLAWPAFALLKTQYPNSHISALVPEYTRPIAELCPWIDSVLIDSKDKSTLKNIFLLRQCIKEHKYDASISLYSELRTAIALWLAGIKVRVAPATKLARLFHNQLLVQRRSKSEKPESEYNIDLVRHYIQLNHDASITPPVAPYLQFEPVDINNRRKHYIEAHNIPAEKKLIIIHPGSGGSAVNLTLEQYAALGKLLSETRNIYLIITAGPGELEKASGLAALLAPTPHSVYHSTNGLVEFCKFIKGGDLFISGSTGPLHIAGALNVPTAAFYPARQSATSLRWQTLNSQSHRLAFSPNKYTGDHDLQKLDMQSCSNQIIQFLDSIYSDSNPSA